MYVGETASGLRVSVTYNPDLFAPQTIGQLMGHYRRVLEAMVVDPAQRIGALQLLSGSERRRLLTEWNATARDYPRECCLHSLVEEQAGRTPGAVAVAFQGRYLTYAELDARANRVAQALSRHGCGRGDYVGICMERSLDLVVAMLAVLKAGCAYVPLDPAFPRERLSFMMADAGIRVLLTQTAVSGSSPGPGCVVIDVDVHAAEHAVLDPSPPRAEVGPMDLAYLIYTSGSTGQPKGVCIEHRALVNFLTAMQAAPGIQTGDVLLSVTTPSFDIFGLEVYLPLVTGARVEIASYESTVDADALAGALEHSGATLMQATPATWQMLVSGGWRGQRGLKALCGGEALTPTLAAQLRERTASLWNLYGPTETTIWSTVERVDVQTLDGAVSIGRPIANTRIYILDAALQPVPVGVTGELCIGGDGVARGYLKRAALTADRFLPDPFCGEPGARIYRTGDLARYRHDGRIEYLGRSDGQVKVRGYRIELGEVEAALSAIEGVRQAAVVCREDTPGDAWLVGYVVSDAGAGLDPERLRAQLRERLPGYMVPAAFVNLPDLPLTPNAKVDRLALPAPTGAARVQARRFRVPTKPAEQALAEVWRELLGVDTIRLDDNFFDLGGHSLLAVKAIFAMKQRTGIAISPTKYMMQNLGQIAVHYAPHWGAVEAAPGTRDGDACPAMSPDIGIPLPASEADQVAELEPLYFGAASTLFACLHAPQGRPRTDRAVVICQATGPEYTRCHRSLRILAAMLARSGHPVLRFDYYATGDSLGEGEEASVARWQDDIATAADFIRDRCPGTRLTLVGVRMGATLAARHAVERGGVARLVLWDPVLDGRAFVEDLRARTAAHEQWLARRHGSRPALTEADGPQDLFGFRYTPSMIDAMAAIDLLSLSGRAAASALILDSLPRRGDAGAGRPPPLGGHRPAA